MSNLTYPLEYLYFGASSSCLLLSLSIELLYESPFALPFVYEVPLSVSVEKVWLNLLLIVSVDVDDLLLAGSAAIEVDLRIIFGRDVGCHNHYLCICDSSWPERPSLRNNWKSTWIISVIINIDGICSGISRSAKKHSTFIHIRPRFMQHQFQRKTKQAPPGHGSLAFQWALKLCNYHLNWQR